MQKFKAERIKKERLKLLDERLPVLDKVLETYKSNLPLNTACPGIGDIFSDPFVLDIIYNSPPGELTESHLDLFRSKLPELTHRTQMTIENKLLSIIKDSGRPVTDDSYTPVPDDKKFIFNLATTVFGCKGCNVNSFASLMRFPRVIVHSCLTMPRWSQKDSENDLCYQKLHSATGQTAWNRFNDLTFNPQTQKILSYIVSLCGFDPKTTTSAEIGAADPILECVACNHPYKGRLTMRWLMAVGFSLFIPI